MTGPSFAMLAVAESVKVFSRLTARVGLVFSGFLGFALPFVVWSVVHSGMMVNGVASEDYFESTGTRPMVLALYARNFLVIRAFLVVLGAQAFAGELAAHTLREDLLRPVHRSSVILAKWLAILFWDAASLALTFACGAVPAVLLLGADGAWGGVVLAFVLNLLCDAGVIALVLAIAVLSRSVVATVAGLLVALVLDWMLGLAMSLAGNVARAFQTSPWVVTALEQWAILPSSAFGIWSWPLPDVERPWESAASLALITASGLAVAIARFRRMEVP